MKNTPVVDIPFTIIIPMVSGSSVPRSPRDPENSIRLNLYGIVISYSGLEAGLHPRGYLSGYLYWTLR